MTSAAVSVRNLTVRYGEFTAVDDISFDVARGEIFGFLGANGAGKTTTIRVLCGLLSPTAGQARVAGQDLSGDLVEVKRRVGYMSQKFTLYDDLTAAENLDFTASLRKLDPAGYRKRRKELLEFVRFEWKMDSLVRDIPGGVRQQLALIASVLHDPEILFLDEPTAGVTPAARARFWELIRSMSAAGKTVFVTTHYMDEAEQCGRIALMRTGRIIALDSPSALKTQAFPTPLYELTPVADADTAAVQAALAHLRHAGADLQPYGMRYHASLSQAFDWQNWMRAHSEVFSTRAIPPTLEDVFLRIVTGSSTKENGA